MSLCTSYKPKPNPNPKNKKVHLIDAIFHLGGHQTEGIFRVPGFPEEVKRLREEIDAGNYQPLKFASQVHSLAAILKM